MQDNITKIAEIIKTYFEQYGDIIRLWCICLSKKEIAENCDIEKELINSRISPMANEIKPLIKEIEDTLEKTDVYKSIIFQLGWKMPPDKSKRKSGLFTLIENHLSSRKIEWRNIENYFKNVLLNTINEKEKALQVFINKLNWDFIIDYKGIEKEFDIIIEENGNQKIYASDIAKIHYDRKELKTYYSLQEMILKSSVPDWITKLWQRNNEDYFINLSNFYNSNDFDSIKLHDYSISDSYQRKFLEDLTQQFESTFDYVNWVNIIEDDEIVPTSGITKLDPNYLDWDLVYDNIKYSREIYFEYEGKYSVSREKALFNKYTKEYLE